MFHHRLFFFTVLFAIFASSDLHAESLNPSNFSGRYHTNTARMSFLDGGVFKCKPLDFLVAQKAQSIRLNLSALNCKNVTADPYDVTFQISGERILMQGLFVGFLRGNTFRIDFPLSSDVALTIFMQGDGGKKLRYLEQSAGRNQTQLLDAPFTKVQ